MPWFGKSLEKFINASTRAMVVAMVMVFVMVMVVIIVMVNDDDNDFHDFRTVTIQ